jgi:hypothetical protein
LHAAAPAATPETLTDDQSDALEDLLKSLEPIGAFESENAPEPELKRVVH